MEGAKEFRAAALGWLRHFEERWSRFKSGSLLCQINAQAGLGPVEVTEEEEEVLRLCDHTYRVSRGLNDPTSFPADPAVERRREPGGPYPVQGEIDEVKKLVFVAFSGAGGMAKCFCLGKGWLWRLGDFGKEYAVDQLIAFAQKFEIEDCLVDLGRGRCYSGGASPWTLLGCGGGGRA